VASNNSSRKISQTEKRRARQGRRKQKSRVKGGLAVLGMATLALLIITGLALPSFGGGASSGQTTTQTLDDRPTGDAAPGDFLTDQGRVHLAVGEVNPVGYYNSTPPTSGTHAPSWVECGIYTEPIQDEFQVHNLEHGFVLIQYNSEDPALITEVASVAEALGEWPNYLIVAPYPEMEHTIALTAWGVTQYMETVDPSDIEAFADAYRGRGPEAGTPACASGGFMPQAG
jgi:hypothetical protein